MLTNSVNAVVSSDMTAGKRRELSNNKTTRICLLTQLFPAQAFFSGHILQQIKDTVCARLLIAALSVSINTGPYLDDQDSLKKPLYVHTGKKEQQQHIGSGIRLLGYIKRKKRSSEEYLQDATSCVRK